MCAISSYAGPPIRLICRPQPSISVLTLNGREGNDDREATRLTLNV